MSGLCGFYNRDASSLLHKFGFRKLCCTSDNLIPLEALIYEADEQHLVAVFFDFEKAYDTVCPRASSNNFVSSVCLVACLNFSKIV